MHQVMLSLLKPGPIVTVEAYREARPAEGAWLRIRVRNPFKHPIHVERLRAIYPRPAGDVVWKVEVDGWEMKHVMAHATTQRLRVFVGAGREMIVAFKADAAEPRPIALGLDWSKRRAAVRPKLPRLIVRTRKQVASLLDPANMLERA